MQQKIGEFIRRKIIPTGLTITDAAKKLGVSRPALSRVLNGHASLSRDMALRLQETFGANASEILGMQEDVKSGTQHRTTQSHRYVPDFLTIKAADIESWSERRIEARSELPVLVRRLVYATGSELLHVDFPGFDNSQRPSFDGLVKAGTATPFVPAGPSAWELSTEKRTMAKANRDFNSGLNKISQQERAKRTFVFVTTRNWTGKNDWAKTKNQLGEWNEVRAYDASDLEQWLESTIAPRIWLAEKLGMPTEGYRTIEAFWDDWANATKPPLTAELFAPSIRLHEEKLREWLAAPPDRPLIVAADSREESIAFIACLLLAEKCRKAAPGSAVLFESARTLRFLAESTAPFVAIIANDEIEREVASVFRKYHCIVVHARNNPFTQPDISIDSLNQYSFDHALADMGIGLGEMARLARQSGLSRTRLRWLLINTAIGAQQWSSDARSAKKLIPMALVGAWNEGFDADREILEKLSGTSYEFVERAVVDLFAIENGPVWCIGKYRGVAPRIDALFAVAPYLIKKDLDCFLERAKYVLTESDFPLEIPHNSRLRDGIVGRTREHSPELRSGILDMLILLAIHGNRLFRDRTEVDVEDRISSLVDRLLVPLTGEKLKSHDLDLPDLAEAAPDKFIEILRKDLKRSESALKSVLLAPKQDLFASPSLTGILWALERLAWHRTHFMDVVLILAEMSSMRNNEGWSSTPLNSLAGILDSRLPQTNVSVSDRILALKKLCREFPDTGWQVCLRQIDDSNRVINYSNRPRWRDAGSAMPTSRNDLLESMQAALDLVLDRPSPDAKAVKDLLPRMYGLDEHIQLKILFWVNKWAELHPVDNGRAEIRDEIGRFVQYLPGTLAVPGSEVLKAAQDLLDQLAPKDKFEVLAAPFRGIWEHFSLAQSQDPSLYLRDWPDKHDAICRNSMADIWSFHGIDGVLRLLYEENKGGKVGQYAAECAHDSNMASEVIKAALLAKTVPRERIDDFLTGFLYGLRAETFAKVLTELPNDVPDNETVRLFRCARPCRETWRLLEKLPRSLQDQYWTTVEVSSGPIPFREYSVHEARILTHHMLRVGRPWDAFAALMDEWDRVDSKTLRCLLQCVTEQGLEQRHFFGNLARNMPNAIGSLARRKGVSEQELADLELASINWIPPEDRKVPNLESRIISSPEYFVYMLSLSSKRGTAGQDPPKWQIEDEGEREIMAVRAGSLLDVLHRLPGQDTEGQIDSSEHISWIAEAQRIASEHGRSEICDLQIGRWLSRTQPQNEAPWPSRPVCTVLEHFASEKMAEGLRAGVHEARGSTTRCTYDGGAQERSLGEEFRGWAEHWSIEYPIVSRILRKISDSYGRMAMHEDHQAGARQRHDL